MKRYILKRVLLAIPILFGITIITFAIIHITPGGPTVLTQQLNVKVSVEAQNKLKSLYGLDKPIYVQYVQWIGRLIKLDFGKSFVDDRKVIDKILERLPATLILNIISLSIIESSITFLYNASFTKK